MRSPSSPARARVVVVEDHVLLAESLELALASEGFDVRRIDPPEEGLPPAQLLSTLLRHRPQIVLLDLDLGRSGDGVRLIAPLARAGAHVVVVTASAERSRWGECLRHGARIVIPKARPLREVLDTVRRIQEGFPVMTGPERDELLRLWFEERRDREELGQRLARLTRREQEVLGHLVAGRTVREIAARSVVSEATVRTQVKSILAKLSVSSQLAAVGIAHRMGWRPDRT